MIFVIFFIQVTTDGWLSAEGIALWLGLAGVFTLTTMDMTLISISSHLQNISDNLTDIAIALEDLSKEKLEV
jgi:hypothetical protein